MQPSLIELLKARLRPLRLASGRLVIPSESPTASIVYKAAEITSSEHVEGDYFEFGVFRGSTLIQAYRTIQRAYIDRAEDRTGIHSSVYRQRVRELWNRMRFFAFDSFKGLPELSGPDLETSDFEQGKFQCSEEECLANLRSSGVDLSKVVTVPGWFGETCHKDTIRRHSMTSASIVHIDCDLYKSARCVLEFIRPLLVDGTILIFDDWYSFRGNPGLGEQRAFREWSATCRDFTFTEFQKEGPWRNSFIASRRLQDPGDGRIAD